jgi:hypothetical protein
MIPSVFMTSSALRLTRNGKPDHTGGLLEKKAKSLELLLSFDKSDAGCRPVMSDIHHGLPLRAAFEKPTIAELAEVITEKQSEAVKPTDLCSLVTELESLSDDEISRHPRIGKRINQRKGMEDGRTRRQRNLESGR